MSKTQKKSKKSKKRNPYLHAFKTAMKIFLLLMLNVVLIIGVLFYNKYGKEIVKLQADAKALVAASTVDTFRQSETTLIYDVNGKLLSTVRGEKDVHYLAYEDIPEQAKQAMISIEDKKFATHNGVDTMAILRAVVALVRNKGEIHQGASTITQQLSRMIFLTNEVSWERKIKEMYIAINLEKKYEKYQILEFYLNNSYFANGHYGIQAASKSYFNKGVDKLTLSQIAFLCAIPNSPTMYDPIDHPENTIKRRDRILKQMLLDKKITQEEHDQAVAEVIKLKVKTLKKNNYVETYVNNSAIRALMKTQGFVFRNEFKSDAEREEYKDLYNQYYEQCQQSLYQAGYRIYTSIDPAKEKLLQAAVDDVLKGFTGQSENGIYELQGAATSIDNVTGRVVAIVGGRSQDVDGYTLNRAYQSYRQPGSSIKPLIVYTPAFQLGYDPAQIVDDTKMKDGPSNSDGTYAGKIPLRRAVELSKNVIAWKVFADITPTVGLSFIQKMDFAKIVPDDYYQASSLGGLTYGVSTVEMASGYAALANDGVFREPTCIIRITDSKGNEIVSDHINLVPVYEENAARMMTDVLKGVLTRGTGRGLGLSNMSSAGKTGTTNDKKDGWFVGYTPYYTTSVWVGYDMPKTLDNLWGSSYPGSIWKQYMSEIHKDLEYKDFPKYTSTYKAPEEEKPVEDANTANTPATGTTTNQTGATDGMDTTATDGTVTDGTVDENAPIDDTPVGTDTGVEGDAGSTVGEDIPVEGNTP